MGLESELAERTTLMIPQTASPACAALVSAELDTDVPSMSPVSVKPCSPPEIAVMP
jgi:hypothetical protein